MRFGVVIFLVVLLVLLVVFIRFLILVIKYKRISDRINKEMAEAGLKRRLRVKKKLREMAGDTETVITDELKERKLTFVESLMEAYGADPAETDIEIPGRWGGRKLYRFRNGYYWVECLDSENGNFSYMAVRCAEDERKAKKGTIDNIEVMGFEFSDDDIEREIRDIFEIESFPKGWAEM